MATIRTVTDPQEKLQAVIDDVRAGNEATRKKIKRLRALLKGGEQEEARLESELAELAQGEKS